MADITPDTELERSRPESAPSVSGHRSDAPYRLEPDVLRVIEFLFFAYRDFTADADEILAELDFGRAHHRALHFICRHPGIRVADLLDILKITKQSLARVLKDLRDRGFVTQIRGANDRRERLLYPRQRGRALIGRLAQRQAERIHAAMQAAGPSAPQNVEQFLFHMIRSDERESIARLIAEGDGLENGTEGSEQP